MITVNDISVQFGGTTFLATSPINENDKIALMGKMEQESQRQDYCWAKQTVNRKHICTKRGCSLFASAFIGY
jgi:hypothetical protein